MYSFIDTTQAASAAKRSSESLCFNGVWIEDEIPGFRMLHTVGRDLMEGELNTREYDGLDGSFFIDRRYPSRTIENTFMMKADSDYEYRQNFNKLNRLLTGDQKKIIYADEPDKYFIGSLSSITDPTPGTNCVVGSFTFECTDPLKYSTTEKAVALQSTLAKNIKTFDIVNEGSVPVPIRYELSMTDETGYVGFASTQGAMEFGKRDEPDGVYAVRDEQLLNWAKFRDASVLEGTNLNGMKVINIAPDTGGAVEPWLEMNFTGTCGTQTWCRAVKRIPIPKDSLGGSGAQKFHFKAKHWFGFAQTDQLGEQVVQFMDSSNNEICAYGITKGAAGMGVELYFRVNGVIKQTIRFASLPETSPFCDGSRGWQSVEKDGNKVTFFWMGTRGPSFTDDAIKTKACDHIDISLAHRPGKPYVTRNYIYPFYFTKTVSGVFDVRNTFFSGTKLVIDGETSKFYQDGVYKPEKEILGTKWFKAGPGTNRVEACFSTWFDGRVNGTAYIREAWL